MAIIHHKTMSPGKLELLAAWLPAQPWYRQTGHQPELAKAGGFRLDDPQGEVGIEFMVVTDGSGHGATAYQVPLTHRACAQAQSVSNAADPTVTGRPVAEGSLTLVRSAVVANAPSGTDLRVETVGPGDLQPGELVLRICRILQPGDGINVNRDAGPPCLSATWGLPDGTGVSGVFAAAQYSRI